MSAEALAAAGYALFLLAAAVALDLLARHSHRRSTRYRTAGFAYRPELDAWVCPEGQHLHRVEIDHERRLARYRGKARICNACPAKPDCTDSDEGREIARALDPWPHSEAGRFHRGISIVLVALSTVIVTAALVRNHSPADLAVLAPVVALSAAAGAILLASFRRVPSGFPEPAGSLGPGRRARLGHDGS